MLAKLGYKEVEGYGGLYDEAAALRRLLDKHGLAMPTGHFSVDMLEKQKADVLKIARALGVHTLVMPYVVVEQRPKSAKGWKDFGKRLNKLGCRLSGGRLFGCLAQS